MNNIDSIISCFLGETKIDKVAPFGNGHINNTIIVKTPHSKYVLQKINTSVLQVIKIMYNKRNKLQKG